MKPNTPEQERILKEHRRIHDRMYEAFEAQGIGDYPKDAQLIDVAFTNALWKQEYDRARILLKEWEHAMKVHLARRPESFCRRSQP